MTGANLTIYYPTADERDATKDELATIAASYGYYTVHQSQQRGDIRDLLSAIVEGEIALILLGDDQRLAAINELRRLAESESTEWTARDAFRDIANALASARSRQE